ncbi:MAG: hypothetical protein K0S09_1330 [Sphingobacteriaceae bacterium]|jgi:hypothetical protein|nr:hypothetical protein [Sphingobacteriaceae bacterium]
MPDGRADAVNAMTAVALATVGLDLLVTFRSSEKLLGLRGYERFKALQK